MNIFKYTREKKRKEKEEADTTTRMNSFRFPNKTIDRMDEMAEKFKETKIFIAIVAIDELYERVM